MTFLTMPTPYDPALIPSQIVTGICLDCDCSRFLTKNGKCGHCGSNSIIKKGAIRELKKQLRLRKVENRK